MHSLALISSLLEKSLWRSVTSSAEVLEVEENFSSGQKGSSACRIKKNPIVSEQLCGLARLCAAMMMPPWK